MFREPWKPPERRGKLEEGSESKRVYCPHGHEYPAAHQHDCEACRQIYEKEKRERKTGDLGGDA